MTDKSSRANCRLYHRDASGEIYRACHIGAGMMQTGVFASTTISAKSWSADFDSRDWQPAKKLIHPFWFRFKTLSPESDMSNCPERKWHCGWIPTSLTLCHSHSQDLLTTWTSALLYRSIPFTPHSAIEKSVFIPPGKGRLSYRITDCRALLLPSAVSVYPGHKTLGLDLWIWSIVLMRVLLHHDSQQAHLHSLEGAPAFRGSCRVRAKGKKATDKVHLWAISNWWIVTQL